MVNRVVCAGETGKEKNYEKRYNFSNDDVCVEKRKWFF